MRLPGAFHPTPESLAAPIHEISFVNISWHGGLACLVPGVTSPYQAKTICSLALRPRATVFRLPVLLIFWLIVAGTIRLPAQQTALPRHTGSTRPLTTAQERILARADEILKHAALSDAERQVRLHVIKATLTGTVIRPADDYPEMRNPNHWTLVNDSFVVAAASTPVEAIADLWVVHQNDGVPVPRIRCLKYSSLVLIQGIIQYFRETNNPAGLAALNRLIGDRNIPQGLPNGGEDLAGTATRAHRARLVDAEQMRRFMVATAGQYPR